MSHHTKLDKNIEGDDNFQVSNYRISLILEENEFESYINLGGSSSIGRWG